MSDQRERAVGRNEAMFRSFNEMVEDVAVLERSDETTFVCECGDQQCEAMIRLELDAYETVRAVSTRFIVRPDHVHTEAEVVVERHSDYWVVEKTGAAAEEASERDPRSG